VSRSKIPVEQHFSLIEQRLKVLAKTPEGGVFRLAPPLVFKVRAPASDLRVATTTLQQARASLVLYDAHVRPLSEEIVKPSLLAR
jgi:hypothetical protein